MKYILILCACIFTLSACYKEDPYWLDENIKEGGTYYPLLQYLFVEPVDTNETDFHLGQDVNLTAQFWSRDEVSKVEFYRVINDSVDMEISIQDYNPVFDPESEAFHQSAVYAIPVDSSLTSVTFKAVIRTVHDLTRERTTKIDID